MPGYAGQIKAKDRWAIVAYVRALQQSQNSSMDMVPQAAQTRVREEVAEVKKRLKEEAEAAKKAAEEAAKKKKK